jgi:N-acetylmuramoyl-L-alanine amidase
MVVLHYTGMATAEDALDRLCDPAAEVSAHYLITETGTTYGLVPEEARAWHAGAGRWGAVTDVNSRSIGIELANPGNHPFPAPQMAALESLLSGVLARHAIPPARVIAHSDMAPARKCDPGPRFDWRRLALQGLSVWPAASPGPHEPLADNLARIGYDPALPPDLALAAFRLRFRPWAQGAADAVDAALAHDLAARFPVDAPPAPA